MTPPGPPDNPDSPPPSAEPLDAAALGAADAADRRSAAGWHRRLGEATATLAARLADLAEQTSAVVITTADGRRHTGVVVAVLADGVVLEAPAGLAVIPATGLATLRADSSSPAAAPRAAVEGNDVASVLEWLAADRATVSVGVAGEVIGGRLSRCGPDVATIVPNAGVSAWLDVSLAHLDWLMVNG